MRRYRFVQLDVFTDHPFGGNQLAVFPQAEGLTNAEMQAIAMEMNYSETTFVLPASTAEALCRVRIFTPATELPFAGHPVIGTTFALAAEGQILPNRNPSPITLELGIGPLAVELLYEGADLSFAWMRQPIPTFTRWQGDTQRLMAALGLTPNDLLTDLPIERGSAGVPFLYVPLRALDVIQRAQPGSADLLDAMASGVDAGEIHPGAFLFTLDAAVGARGVDVHGRMFGPAMGIREDAATGSAAGPLGAYLVRHGRITPNADGEARIRLEQGVEMGRPSRIEIAVTAQVAQGKTITGVRVGGTSVLVAEGDLLL
ncbi:MAG: PhzF family phenazine biosynthesis protein [Ktedonobacterales bacterium]